MVNYTDNDVAAMRAAAAAQLQRDLATGQTRSGSNADVIQVGRGVSRGANIGFLEAVKARGGISRAEEFAITGNVSREMQPVKNLIADLEQNRQARMGVKGVSSVEARTISSLPVSHYEELFGNPADLAPQPRQAVSNTIPPTLASPKIAMSEIASGVSVPSENLVQIGQSVDSTTQLQGIPAPAQPQIIYQDNSQDYVPSYDDVYLASDSSADDSDQYYDDGSGY